MVAADGAIWQEPCGAEGSFGLNSRQQLIILCPREVNKPSHFRAGAGKFTDDQIVAKVPWPIEVVQHTWEPFMGQPIVQKVPGTCALVACTVCVEAVHRLEHEKLHGKGTTFPYRAAPPDDLLEACRTDEIWKPSEGADIAKVLTKIQQMGGVPATNTATLAQCFLPLHSWRQHSWNDDSAGGGFSPERVANLLYNNGPCIGLLWVLPMLYDPVDADRDDTLVYSSGCGPSDEDARRKLEELHPGEVAWHAGVCIGYRFHHGKMHVRVLDNHTPTGPRRWIDAEEFHTLYTLSLRSVTGDSIPAEPFLHKFI